MRVIEAQSSPPTIYAKIARVDANPSLPNKLCNDKKVARFDAGTFGATAAFSGAVIRARGQLRSNVAIAG